MALKITVNQQRTDRLLREGLEGVRDMCGITGWVDFGRDLRGERPTIEAITATMACRGPDAGRVWCSEHAAIGHRRLAVIDIPGGEQPMRAPGGGHAIVPAAISATSGWDDVVLTFGALAHISGW